MNDNLWGVEAHDLRVVRTAGGGGAGFELFVRELRLTDTHERNKLPIMGPSGSGKSTLLNSLAAISHPSNAEATIHWRFPDGREMRWGAAGPNKAESLLLRRHYFGFAFQNAAMLPHLTVGQNLINFLRLTGVRVRDAQESARNALRKVIPDSEPEALFNRYFSEISGGQRQRVALVQSMIHDPCVLFADEPTGSLDPVTRRVVMKVLTDWIDEKPGERMLLWVTHHQDDPLENGARHRILIEGGNCREQAWGAADAGWKDWIE